MPQETDRKMMEILRILADRDDVIGAKIIAEELRKKGYELGERAVRYHMRILDEKGFTERVGYAGRRITDAGLKELEEALIYDQVDFIFSKFEDMIYNTTLNPETGEGKVIVNTSSFPRDPNILEVIKKVFRSGIAVSPFVRILNPEDNSDEFKLDTICGTTIDGMLLKNGIPVIPQYGGLVKVKDNIPLGFTELIAYKKTSMTPLEAFTEQEMTSVLRILEKGSGTIPANFRLIPSSAHEEAKSLFNQLRKIGIDGLIKMGSPGENVLGIPVDEDMIGIAIVGGISPLCAAKEAGYTVNIKLAENIVDFSEMERIISVKPLLKNSKQYKIHRVKFILSKAWNLIHKVNFDLETRLGQVIANISYVDNKDRDDALDIFEEVMKTWPEYCTSRYFQILSEPTGKIGIVTVCSLTIDGILTKQGISTIPQYSGILELGTREPRFIELTAYSGSSLDPHEIYLSKNMTSILNTTPNGSRILASLREIPYIARPEALKFFEDLEDAGFSIINVGKPSELIYNAKVERYHVGVVTPGGLNPIAAIKESGIPVEAKAVETMMDISKMEEF